MTNKANGKYKIIMSQEKGAFPSRYFIHGKEVTKIEFAKEIQRDNIDK